MEEVYVIKFRNDPKAVFCMYKDKLSKGDFVAVETSLGCEGGEVIAVEKKNKTNSSELLTITRKINNEEKEALEMTDEDRDEYMEIFTNLIKKHDLQMKPISVDMCVDDKIVFTFSADNRIDFRELVRELSNKTKKLVILKQIGSRDCARAMDGYGPCGRRLCCKQFLASTEGVTIDMARLQGMSSKGTAKISGCCGRLMCCLKFENGCYKETLNRLPKIGSKIKTEKGTGTVIFVSPVKSQVEVELKDGTKVEVNI